MWRRMLCSSPQLFSADLLNEPQNHYFDKDTIIPRGWTWGGRYAESRSFPMFFDRVRYSNPVTPILTSIRKVSVTCFFGSDVFLYSWNTVKFWLLYNFEMNYNMVCDWAECEQNEEKIAYYNYHQSCYLQYPYRMQWGFWYDSGRQTSTRKANWRG